MRYLFFLLLISLSFSSFNIPPIGTVISNNTQTALSMTNVYSAANAANVSFMASFSGHTVPIPISLSIAAEPSLLLDNATYAEPGLIFVVPMGYSLGHLLSMPDGRNICDSAYAQTLIQAGNAAPCDFDQDSCVEYETQQQVIPLLSGTFILKNTSVTVPVTSSSLSVPQEIVGQMNDSSGADLLTLDISGNFNVTYTFDDRQPSVGSCSDHFVNQSLLVPVSMTSSFAVAGSNRLFFLAAPVTGEQWFRNNHFDLIVLSQSPLYHFDVYQNNISIQNTSIRTFYTVIDNYGLVRIVSNKTPSGSFSENKNLTKPIPLETTNHSFVYIYYINSTYSGLGQNNLTLSVNDSFLGTGNYSQMLLSRMLSYNGVIMENGAQIDSSMARPSALFDFGTLNAITISAALLTAMVLAVFVNFWLKKDSIL